MIIREIWPICDQCEESFPLQTWRTEKACIEALKRSGWKVTRTKQVCPYCAKNLWTESRLRKAENKELQAAPEQEVDHD